MKRHQFAIVDSAGQFVMGGRTTDLQAIQVAEGRTLVLGSIDPTCERFDESMPAIVQLPSLPVGNPVSATVGELVPIEVPPGTCFNGRGGPPVLPVEGRLVVGYADPGEYLINLACEGYAHKTIMVQVTEARV